jgi:pimeloyl-ACP methyl ester carboxylesterase
MNDDETRVSIRTCSLADGRTLAYRIFGDPDGAAVVVHHGTPGSRLFGRLLAEAATDAGIKLVVPDRPGFGRSSSPPNGWTWTDWPTDFEALLRTESIERAGVLGFSGGGPFALAAAKSARATRLGVVSTVVPPADDAMTRLARIPLALGLFFRFSGFLARKFGPSSVVKQYTNRSVSEPVATAVGADFQESLRKGGRAVHREMRTFGAQSLDVETLSVPMRAWHGTADENTPLPPVRSLVESQDGELRTSGTDHLGMLLDHRADIVEWVGKRS